MYWDPAWWNLLIGRREDSAQTHLRHWMRYFTYYPTMEELKLLREHRQHARYVSLVGLIAGGAPPYLITQWLHRSGREKFSLRPSTSLPAICFALIGGSVGIFAANAYENVRFLRDLGALQESPLGEELRAYVRESPDADILLHRYQIPPVDVDEELKLAL